MKDYILYIVYAGIIIVNGIFAYMFFTDYFKHREEAKQEVGNPIIMFFSSFILYFLSTFGVSDYALSTAFYKGMRWLEDKKIPGTLNTQCVLPVAVMALSYIKTIEVDILTLILCIISQTLGSYILPRFVVKLKAGTIRKVMGFALILATVLILLSKSGLYPLGGDATALRGPLLYFTVFLFAIFGAMNTIGIGSYPVTMLTVYLVGLNPVIAFPIMMGACTFSVPVGSMEYVRLGQYGRKISMMSNTVGILGVLLAVYVVKSLDTNMIQWLVAAVLLYSGSQMLHKEYSKKAA